MKNSLIPFVPFVLVARDFRVAAGAQRTLTAAERILSATKCWLGDKAVIIIPAEMADGRGRWRVFRP